jgi:hypothetical protein
MIYSIRIRLVATAAAALVVLGGAATRAAASGDYQPFLTDFPKPGASAAFTPFVTDFGIAARPGGTVVIRSATPTSPVRATGRDWTDLGVGAGVGLGFAAVAAAAGLGVRRRRSSADPIAALRAGTAE